MLVRLENIDAGYQGQLVLEKVNLEIGPKDFIGVIGPNGGGKSTLLKLILGTLKPLSGKIVYKDDRALSEVRIGYLPQRSGIDAEFPIRVIDVVLSGGGYGRQRQSRGKAMEWLEMIGLKGFHSKMIHHLSGGELQRVLIARALICEPELLLLDEPDTYVDNEFEKDLSAILEKLNKEMAIVMVSHDAGMISSNVRSIACVNRKLHYHPSNLITAEDLSAYGCPIDLITHGDLPHRVLHQH